MHDDDIRYRNFSLVCALWWSEKCWNIARITLENLCCVYCPQMINNFCYSFSMRLFEWKMKGKYGGTISTKMRNEVKILNLSLGIFSVVNLWKMTIKFFVITLTAPKSHKNNKRTSREFFASSKLIDMENEIFLPSFPFFRSHCPPHSLLHFSFSNFFFLATNPLEDALRMMVKSLFIHSLMII